MISHLAQCRRCETLGDFISTPRIQQRDAAQLKASASARGAVLLFGRHRKPCPTSSTISAGAPRSQKVWSMQLPSMELIFSSPPAAARFYPALPAVVMLHGAGCEHRPGRCTAAGSPSRLFGAGAGMCRRMAVRPGAQAFQPFAGHGPTGPSPPLLTPAGSAKVLS